MWSMAKKPVVSVVVPIYKVEKYLRECVDSILAQTLADIEVILVDDGSPDACPQICDEYAAKDARVRVIHQPNGGLGKAYNTGIAAARGKYVGLVESDDWIEPDMYEVLYQAAEKHQADLVKCGFFNYNSFNSPQNTKQIYGDQRINLENCSPVDAVFRLEEYPLILCLHPSVWATLYKADFIKSLKFSENSGAAYQDLPFMWEALLKADKIAVVQRELLHYRQEPGNMSSVTRTDRKLLDLMKLGQEMYCRFVKDKRFEAFREEFFYTMSDAGFHFYAQIDDEFRDEFYAGLRQIFTEMDTSTDTRLNLIKPERIAAIKALQEDNRNAFDKIVLKYKKRVLFPGVLSYVRRGNRKSVYVFGVELFRRQKINRQKIYKLGPWTWK